MRNLKDINIRKSNTIRKLKKICQTVGLSMFMLLASTGIVFADEGASEGLATWNAGVDIVSSFFSKVSIAVIVFGIIEIIWSTLQDNPNAKKQGIMFAIGGAALALVSSQLIPMMKM